MWHSKLGVCLELSGTSFPDDDVAKTDGADADSTAADSAASAIDNDTAHEHDASLGAGNTHKLRLFRETLSDLDKLKNISKLLICIVGSY